MKLEEIEKRLQKFPPDPFSKVEYEILGQPPIKYDFVDRELIGKPGIHLERLTDESIAALGRVVIPMLSSPISEEVAAAIFLLAYHLKAPGSRFRAFIFNSYTDLQVSTDKRYKVNVDATNAITATDDATKEAAVYSYIAASLFRVLTKPASYYVKTWPHVLNGFSKSYNTAPVTMTLPAPTESAINNFQFYFNNRERFKVTLYRFLYMSNSDQRYNGFKTFLYDNYFKNTGLHVVSIIEQLSDVLECSMGSIIIAIQKGDSKWWQVKCLFHVLRMMTANDENHKMNMWRYGRLFDRAFLSNIQTKSCLKLVYVLAEALRSEAPERNSGILQIAQFAEIREDAKREMAIVGKRLLRRLKDENPSI